MKLGINYNWRVSLARKNCWYCFWRKVRDVWIILITKRKCLKRPSNWGKMIPINNASEYNRTVAVFLLFAFFYDNVSAIRCTHKKWEIDRQRALSGLIIGKWLINFLWVTEVETWKHYIHMITTREVYCGTANECLVPVLSLRSHFKKKYSNLCSNYIMIELYLLLWSLCGYFNQWNRAAFGLSFSMGLCIIERKWSVRIGTSWNFFQTWARKRWRLSVDSNIDWRTSVRRVVPCNEKYDI